MILNTPEIKTLLDMEFLLQGSLASSSCTLVLATYLHLTISQKHLYSTAYHLPVLGVSLCIKLIPHFARKLVHKCYLGMNKYFQLYCVSVAKGSICSYESKWSYKDRGLGSYLIFLWQAALDQQEV